MTLAQPALMFLCLAAALPALAQQDQATSQQLAMGGTGAAHAHDNGALTVNPAAIGLASRYRMDVIGGFWDGRDFRAGVVAVDGVTNKGVALGVGYQYYRSTSPLETDELPGFITAGEALPNRRLFNAVTLGLALPIAENRFSIGLGGQLMIVNHAVLGTKTSGDLDVGLAGRPTEAWSIGVSVRNVLPQFVVTDESIGLTAGTRYAWNEWTSVALDVDVPFTAVEGLPLSIRGGAEVGQDLRHLGIGYRYEGPTQEHWLSLGGGLWSDPNSDQEGGNLAGLHYAMQIPFHDKGDALDQLLGVRHTLTISIMPKPNRKKDR